MKSAARSDQPRRSTHARHRDAVAAMKSAARSDQPLAGAADAAGAANAVGVRGGRVRGRGRRALGRLSRRRPGSP